MSDAFKAFVVDKTTDGVVGTVKTLTLADLPEGEVLVAVAASTLNYKDGLVAQGLGNLVKTYPHVPGVDFAGTVMSSTSPDYKPGDAVILTGWRVGEIHWGGYAQRAQVQADWLVPLPPELSPRQAMAVGTAGLTAMLCVMALEDGGVTPDKGPILVTGATGGVGSVSVAILSRLGYEVVAMTGKDSEHAYLKELGATSIIDRAELSEPSNKPLERETWAGVVDGVGGVPLARALAQMKYNGVIASCGLAASAKLDTTVIPFLLRGVKLIGIDSVMKPKPDRMKAWARIAKDLPLEKLEAIASDHSLDEIPELAKQILTGKTRGRIVIDVNR
ncbi:MAG: oxidoreductase [Rhodospirillaceae bacterium]|nr:oxidoreductase [Rhodospirillaceae bacterium]